MKTLAFILVVLFGATLFSGSLFALDPSEETLSCITNDEATQSSEGRDCEIVRCEWRVNVNNWPEASGYSEDCDPQPFVTSAPFLGGMVFVAYFSVWAAIHHRHKAHPGHDEKAPKTD